MLSNKVVVLQHVACEKPGLIAEAVQSHGFSLVYTYTFEGQPVPQTMGEASALVVMGGPMGVYEQERYPFLVDEIRLIARALQEKKPILGVCLGSQLLAAALGASVTPAKEKEIGWHPVTLTESAKTDPLWMGLGRNFVPLHWHGDVFELPPSSVPLASSDRTACQAFRYGSSAYGILFHMESTEAMLKGMIRTFEDELREAGIDGDEVARKGTQHFPPLRATARRVFDRWAELVELGGKLDPT